MPCFFELICPDSQHNNVNSLRVCQLLLEARALTPAELKAAAVVDKVSDKIARVLRTIYDKGPYPLPLEDHSMQQGVCI